MSVGPPSTAFAPLDGAPGRGHGRAVQDRSGPSETAEATQGGRASGPEEAAIAFAKGRAGSLFGFDHDPRARAPVADSFASRLAAPERVVP